METADDARQRGSSVFHQALALAMVAFLLSAYGASRTEWWCVNERAAQMEQLEELARGLFGPMVADVGVVANCGGDTGEHYKHAQAFIRMREGVTVKDVRNILLEAGWDTDPPGGGATFTRRYSPDGAYEVRVSWTEMPGIDYRFADVALEPTLTDRGRG
jgi:hypothetical protein